MFSALRPNSLLYVLDKTNKPTLKLAKVVSVSSILYKGIDPYVNVIASTGEETLNLNELPANMNIADSVALNAIVSESRDAIANEVENLLSNSTKILNDIDYHKEVVESCNEMLITLSPKFAKEKEQESKINTLESKVVNIENTILDVKTMLTQVLNNKKGE